MVGYGRSVFVLFVFLCLDILRCSSGVVTMTELCKHPSAESEMRGPIICPKVAMSMWTCSRYASLESEVNTSIPSDGWEVELTNLANLLYKNNHKIAFVGDSISLQMREMFKCSVLSTGKYEGDFNKYVIFHRSPLLSRLPEDYTYGPSDYNLDWLMSDLWAQYAIFDNVKYIVINTGAWWGYPRLHKWNQPALKNTIQVAKLLKEHFKVGGRLWTLLTDLQMIYNMTIIWRDTAPAGICDLRKMKFKSTKYHYHEGLSMLNEVGRQFISDLGGLVIPNIWESSIHRWREHVGDHDRMHWCLYQSSSVPAAWNHELAKLLYKFYNRKDQNK